MMTADDSYAIEMSTSARAPFEFVEVAPNRAGLCPESLKPLLAIDTVHDGATIPERLLSSSNLQPLIKDGTLQRHFTLERDWGADVVAKHLAHALGLRGFNRVSVARLVLDFNRFPGSSPPDAPPLDRLAIITPFSVVLSNSEKRDILRSFYDPISEGMEASILGKLIKISVHTYDAFNPSRTERPEVSLITRSLSYQLNSKLPFGLFDPLFPDVLTESSCNPILRDRLSLTLEKGGVNVEHNYPYCAPDGSLEVRAQPWFYFQKVRAAFEKEHPETKGVSSFNRVWAMLLNTNLRDGDAEALRGFLHRFRGAPAGLQDEFVAAVEAYQKIARFTQTIPELVNAYRNSPDRPSSLSIEVRKDLVFKFVKGRPVEPIEENARAIALKVAEGIATYLRSDREELLARNDCSRFELDPAPPFQSESGL